VHISNVPAPSLHTIHRHQNCFREIQLDAAPRFKVLGNIEKTLKFSFRSGKQRHVIRKENIIEARHPFNPMFDVLGFPHFRKQTGKRVNED